MPATFAMDSVTLEAASTIVDQALAKGARDEVQAPRRRRARPARLPQGLQGGGRHTSLMRFEIAFGKAWGALGMGFGTRELARRSAQAADFFNALQAMSAGKIVPAAGGVLIRNDAGLVVGAVGVSGDASENDEMCAVHGITAAGLKPDTGDTA
jgi:uncharacterized protein GlcG (DUF336 family)